MARKVRVAVAQYAPVVGDRDGNRKVAAGWARRAADAGTDLLVLPELASSGYVFESEAEAAATADEPASSPLVEDLAAVCASSGMHCVVGLNERAGRVRHNSAVLLGPDGHVVTYRKMHLFNDEKSWFAPGDELPVVDLPFGRVGMLICFDMWFPEAVRALALGAAELVAVPTNWVGSFKHTVYDAAGNCQGNILAMAASAQNGVVMACADRTGNERGVQFLGCSVIVGSDGWPVAGPASPTDDALLVADVDLDDVTMARTRTPRNDLFGDRRAGSYTAVPVRAAPAAHTTATAPQS